MRWLIQKSSQQLGAGENNYFNVVSIEAGDFPPVNSPVIPPSGDFPPVISSGDLPRVRLSVVRVLQG